MACFLLAPEEIEIDIPWFFSYSGHLAKEEEGQTDRPVRAFSPVHLDSRPFEYPTF